MDTRPPVHKIQISGATLSAVLHRSSASPGDLHGLLFGHLSLSTPAPLSDHHHEPTPPTPTLTITSFLSLPAHLPLPTPQTSSTTLLLGFFSSRRKTQLQPSLKDSITLDSLSASYTKSQSPLIFLLVTTPSQENTFHTHEYKAFLCRNDSSTFEARSLDVVNIGPSFRSQYESFSPNVGFPMMGFENLMMVEDDENGGKSSTDLVVLDSVCDEGFGVDRLSKLMGSESGCTGEVEGLYESMLAKMEMVKGLVEETDAKVLEQENHNMRLRCRVAGLESPSQ